MSLLQNPIRLAQLLSSINISNSDRPLSPIETAEVIHELLIELGDDKLELEKRLPLSKSMINNFFKLLFLPPKIKDMIKWGESSKRTGEISFSSACKLSNLKNENDILKLVYAITNLSRPITKTEVADIVSLKNKNHDKSIDDCIKEILNVNRPLIIEHFIFISGIQTSIVKLLQNLSENKSISIGDFAINELSTIFPPNSIKGIKIYNDYTRISFTQEGITFINDYIKYNNILRRDTINHIFTKILS